MALQKSRQFEQVQRIQATVEGLPEAKCLKICVENYDQGLGWYSGGSLTIPLHQVPLLEQALQAARAECPEAKDNSPTIVPFPGLRTPPGPAAD
jgi:hypothetical protein